MDGWAVVCEVSEEKSTFDRGHCPLNHLLRFDKLCLNKKNVGKKPISIYYQNINFRKTNFFCSELVVIIKTWTKNIVEVHNKICYCHQMLTKIMAEWHNYR